METIPKVDCEKIGFFRKTHGVRGELVLEFEEQYEYSVEEAERFFVEIEGLLVPFFISDEGLRFRSAKSVIVKFDWVDTETYAKRLVGQTAWLYKSEVVDMPEESSASFENFLLLDKNIGVIGKIEAIEDYSGNIVLTVSYQGGEVLIPFHEEMLVEINEEQKTMILDLPDGILEQ
jgi:16S rRNA processing protein RimM